MAVYFDFKIKPKEDNIIYTRAIWHKSFPLLAAASHNEKDEISQVDLHLDEGEELRSSVISKSSVTTSCLCWHPSRKVLSTGWSNGEITNWNEHENEQNEGPAIHKNTITCLQWNGTGSRLISTDEDGLLCVWKVDQRGRMQQSPLFRHTLGIAIKCLVFKSMISSDIAADIAAAARAAVSGDQTALDLFEWQKSGQGKFSVTQADSIQMYFGLKNGNVNFLDDRGKCSQCFQVEGGVKYLVYYQDKDIVLTISEGLILTQHSISKESEFTEIHKVKLSGQSINFCIAWAGNGLLATSCKERVARVLDIDNDENFVLNLDGNSSFAVDECITSVSYCEQKGVLAGGTNKGHVAMWKYNPASEDSWELQPASDVQGVVQNISWGTTQSLLAVNCNTSITILSESIMNSCFNDKTAAVQLHPNQLSLETFPGGQVYDIKTDVHIKGVSCTKNHVVIWNGKKVAVYEVLENKAMVRAAGTFNSDSQTIGVYEHNIYLLESDKITVRTFQGTVKQELSFLDQEGEPTDMNIFKIYLCVGTSKGVLKIYDLSRREARQVGTAKSIEEIIPGFTGFQSIKCNCNGTKVAFTMKTGSHTSSSYLYLWDVENDSTQSFNFATGKSNVELEDELAASQAQIAAAIKGYSPLSIHWDSTDPKLLSCEAVKISADKKSLSNSKNKTKGENEGIDAGLIIVSMFSTPDVGLIVQDHFPVDMSVYSVLMGIDMPHFYFVKSNKEAENATKKSLVIQKTFRDFIGLENADDSVLKAMSDFSYLSAIGNMDEAFKAIKTIKSGSVWENMARMCVKTKRLDVAMVCLGNMGNPAAAKAVRECQKQEPEIDAHVAMLAIQIGMNEEAEKLYKECKRYDLLNQFYQASDNWKQAIECAETKDRIHLRTTYYNYGKYLESHGNMANAILQYERSDTHKFEVPRMLFEQQEKLEAYITKQKDGNLYKWWAQYNESIGEMDTALHYYELSKEYLSMVRVLCYCNNLERASQLCNDIGDKAACYHLARQFESNNDARNAIHYFSRAHAYSNAIRLAKESEMDHELVSLALLSTQENMLDCARYFELKHGMEDKAVLLYHKGGSVSKAIDLAFKTQQFGALQLISEDLDENADPEILRKCAEFFISHDQYERAVNLLVVAKRFDEALAMCEDHHIDLTEDLAEKMTPSKDDNMSTDERNSLLEKIGECAYRQGFLHLATKKFTQAGNRVKAMKALLKSGDTEKIIFFAGVSRQREIYVMAANYLQSLDWRRDPEIMKNIISFYTKGRSLESLSSFYDACAQVEIDEFQNYEKAFGALSESYKCLSKSKSKNSNQQEERLAHIKTRLTQMKAFIQAKKSYEINPEESVQECLQLLTESNLSSSVRVGDVYGFVIQHYYAAQSYDQAYQIIEDMRSRYPKLKLQSYLKATIIEQIHKQVGAPIHSNRNGFPNGQMESDGEDLDEEIEETEPDDYI